MSRIPQPSSTRTAPGTTLATTPTTPSRPRAPSSSARVGASTTSNGLSRPTTPAVRKKTSAVSLKAKGPTSKPVSPTKTRPPKIANESSHAASEKPSGTPSLSIREAIALKRAEAKKAQTKGSVTGLDTMPTLEDALPPHAIPAQEDEDILGRATLRETIEKARSTGTLNVATRSLKCLPSALFEIHLNITPERLKSVSDESPLPPAPIEAPTNRSSRKNPAWFEAQDLRVLKACGNDIQEIQHEISLFGSLKIVDFHSNTLASVPDTLADLSMLANLDLSHNKLTALPNVLFALPELTHLNISHNTLTSLPFNAYFASLDPRSRNNHNKSTDFFAPEIVRAITPLPKLLVMEASHNCITADSIDTTLPKTLVRIDLSSNPLGSSRNLLKVLGNLPRIKQIMMEKADIGDDSFPFDLFPPASFPSLKVLDLAETGVTKESVCTALKGMKQELNHDFTRDDPPDGVTRVIVGKKVMKEAWEIELEKRAYDRVNRSFDLGGEWVETPRPTSTSPAPSSASNVTSVRSSSSRTTKNIREVVKEAWELEAEAGLLTEGGRRRARAAATPQEQDLRPKNGDGIGKGRPLSLSRSSPVPSLTLSSPQFYSASTQTLTLPPSQPPKPAGHNRTFSLATKMIPSSSSSSSCAADMAVPPPSLPLNAIAIQPFAHSLRSLTLVNRRADRSFALPSSTSIDPHGFLPCLEELDLEGCNFSDMVPVLRADVSPSLSSSPPSSPPTNFRTNEPLLPLLATLFPSLRTLNLSYNALTSSALTQEALFALVLSFHPDGQRENGVAMTNTAATKKGLRHLRLRGNRITDLDGFTGLAGMFKGNRDVSEWKLEELDLRDNEIGRLPPEIGLLPLDVFLVDGNTFRVPQRRVWEREGTKGLLSWLRGRIE
ncbi:hypothetical protein AGABI2DRAFT_201906 [Agaricus bisporus var. bisporus H97]|uniref:hypothetical protein n=1 Tax=Agaricus bisporus var. bisporus (strain H97 / ATCC MYA-4626 / FGSC 10389) TaxID=936046 RepID=UPI00029F6B6C|nr:hypothetical protein AGABI2DRAFT_201906 [Agaricus bisporus var. bisporus H97]EKV49478.1 hypothetical protein AGABI2DRAFT_201906 [Agaricus bisporus var. bisporus H97]